MGLDEFVRKPTMRVLDILICERSRCERPATHFVDSGHYSGIFNASMCEVHASDKLADDLEEYERQASVGVAV